MHVMHFCVILLVLIMYLTTLHHCCHVHRVLEDQLRAEKRRLSAAYSDAVAAVRQMLADSREMHTLLLHTHTYVHSVIAAHCCC